MLRLPEIITEGMILKHNAPLVIWGETDSDIVWVMLDGTAAAESSGGRFEVELPPQKTGGPHTLEIKTEKESIVLNDIYFGEVWLAGGQSNMEFLLSGDEEKEYAKTIAGTELVRQFAVPKASHKNARILNPENYKEKPKWVTSDRNTCEEFSAVAWWSAINYSKKYGVPVGIIYCCWGGTSASCWISREDLAENETTALYLDDYARAMEGKTLEDYILIYTDYYNRQKIWEDNVRYLTEKEGLSEKDASEDPRAGRKPEWPPPHGPWNFGSPANLYEGMLSEIIPYSLSKVLWYQGEEDVRVYERYFELMTCLISCFRKYFRSRELPFYIVQIAPYPYPDDEKAYNKPPYLREKQSEIVSKTENTSLIVTTDCGDKNDIHPRKKRVIGERIFNIMCAENGEAIDVCSAKMVKYEKRKGSFVIYFDKPLSGEKAKGFILCDENLKWHQAEGIISGCSVTVTSPEVSDPCAARYAFASYIYSDLYGENGLPAEPCRTDSFAPDETDMSVCE